MGILDCAHESRILSSSKYLLDMYNMLVFMSGAEEERLIQKEAFLGESPLE